MKTIPWEAYIQALLLFHVALRKHFTLWFKGHDGRDGRTERMLPRLVKKGKIGCARYGRRYVYWSRKRYRKQPADIYHGLMCTEALVRFCVQDKGEMVIPEVEFRRLRLGVVPEWGILYEGAALLFEFGTRDNFIQTKGKVTKYKKKLSKLQAGIHKQPAIVLFVVDVPRSYVKRAIARLQPGEHFYFCDKETFLRVPYGKQLTAPIYLWGADGNPYPFRE